MERCEAKILIKHDRYGGFVDRCERHLHHVGKHWTTMDACEPVAYKCWEGTYEAPERKLLPSTIAAMATPEETAEMTGRYIKARYGEANPDHDWFPKYTKADV